MFCCTLLYVHFSIAIILMGKRELVALLNLSSWCLVMVERLFLAVPRGCLQFVIVVFPDHTHLLFLLYNILTCTNKTIRELSSRQIAFNLENNQSYFRKVQDILNIYDLPNLQCLSEGLTSKEIWKLQVKRAINKHWSELLQRKS